MIRVLVGAEFIRLHPELELTEVVISEGPFEAFPRSRWNERGPTATLQGIPRSPRNLPGHNSANRPRRRFRAS
jgi:hypothetical protein